MSKLFSKSKSLNESINSKSRDAFIQIDGISKTFNTTNAVKNVNLNIHKGELFTILGGSGCGKSTLLKIIAGLEIPDQGSVVIDGIDMSNIPANERPMCTGLSNTSKPESFRNFIKIFILRYEK